LPKLVGKVPGGAIEDLKKQLSHAQARHQRGELSQAEQHEMKEKFTRLQKFEQAEKGENFVADNVGCTAICVLVREADIGDGEETRFFQVGKEYQFVGEAEREKAMQPAVQADWLEIETYLDRCLELTEYCCRS